MCYTLHQYSKKLDNRVTDGQKRIIMNIPQRKLRDSGNQAIASELHENEQRDDSNYGMTAIR